MKQEQVDPIPLVPDAKAFLEGDKRELASRLQKEFLQMLDESVFQFTLGVFVLQVQKFENERIAEVVVGGDFVVRLRLRCERAPGSLRPFIELGSDLPIQLADGPAAAKRFGLIRKTGQSRPARSAGERSETTKAGTPEVAAIVWTVSERFPRPPIAQTPSGQSPDAPDRTGASGKRCCERSRAQTAPSGLKKGDRSTARRIPLSRCHSVLPEQYGGQPPSTPT